MLRWSMMAVVPALACMCIGVTGWAAESAFDPVQDDPKLPRVLLIGDSISIGYTVPVQRMLKGKANVHRIPVNGAYSAFGLEHIREWLGDGKWDVINFNFGIWDTHLLDANGNIIDTKFDQDGKLRTGLAQYQDNLNRLIDVMRTTGAKLIWASTTPVPGRRPERLKDIDRYNLAAARVMRKRRVEVDDLHSYIEPHVSQMQISDGCHYTDKGSEFLAKQVSETILRALASPNPQPSAWDAQQTGEQIVEGRRVLRFEHDCTPGWGYAEKERQYFYVVEPKRKGDGGPLMVCLHSAGGTGESEMPANVAKIAEAGDEFTGLIPNSGSGSEWWWGADEIRAHPDKYEHILTPTENRVLATVELVAAKYHVDPNRIYMRGISMGGSGTLGLGMCHGNTFAALYAGVPAGTEHAAYRVSHSSAVGRRAGAPDDIPPVVVFFSQKDDWSKGMEGWLDAARRDRLAVAGAWGPWGHLNHYEMTNPAACEFPWLTIRKDEAYPAFTNASSDNVYPGLQSDAPDQDGQMNAYFRWKVVSDQASGLALQIRLVRSEELKGAVAIPAEVVVDVTPRRLQRFRIAPGESYDWRIEQAGRNALSGRVIADAQGLLTVPRVHVSADPLTLRIGRAK